MNNSTMLYFHDNNAFTVQLFVWRNDIVSWWGITMGSQGIYNDGSVLIVSRKQFWLK